MSIVFLHLSDIHAEKDKTLENLKLTRMIDAIKSISNSCDEFVLIFSGDIAFSGNYQEYSRVHSMITTIIKGLKVINNRSYIRTCFVPGNHDISFPPCPRGSKEIIEWYKDDIDKYYCNELSLTENFRQFSRNLGCTWSNSEVKKEILRVDGCAVQINLVNTTAFSTLEKDNKELHYLSKESLDSIYRMQDIDLSIVVMHHSVEWFHDQVKSQLERVLYSQCDIVFQGHEHEQDSVDINKGIGSLHVLKGGEYSGRMTHVSSFSTLILDTTSRALSEHVFTWNQDKSIFICNSPRSLKIIDKTQKLCPNYEFRNDLLKDSQGLSDCISKYYTFPSLTERDGELSSTSKIDTIDMLLEKAKTVQTINIVGKSFSGKSTLLKFIYYHACESGVTPIIINSDEIIRPKKLKNLIQDLFYSQYIEDEAAFAQYLQLPKEKRIVLIDDLDNIDSTVVDDMFDMLQNMMGNIYITYKDNLTNSIIDRAKKKLGNRDMITFEIADFYKTKRTELIRNACNCVRGITQEDIDSIVIVVDQLVKKRFGLFSLSPDYIIKYIKYFISKAPQERKKESVFNEIFETNIRTTIINNAKEKDVSEFLVILEEIAFEIHFNRTEALSLSSIEAIINSYSAGHLLEINSQEFITAMLRCKILVQIKGSFSYKFLDRNYLAYFVAKKINKLIQKQGLGIPELNYLLEHICYNINDNILLFLSYLRESTQFVMTLCDQAERMLDSIPEIDFDKGNIGFLSGRNPDKVSLPTSKDKQIQSEICDVQEKTIREREEIEYNGLYYDEEPDVEITSMRISRAMKYLEMISKSLLSQNTVLDIEDKKRIINCLYILPSKALYALLEPYANNYNEVIDELMNFTNTLNFKNKPSRERVEEILSDCAFIFCLNVYDNVIYPGANSKTLPAFQVFKRENSNHHIINLMAEENGGTSKTFIEKAIVLVDEHKNDPMLRYAVKVISKKHLLTHESIDFALLDQLADKVFPGTPKPALLVWSQRNN